jgi:amino acid transporter
MFLVTNLVVVVLRLRRPDVDRPFRVPGNLASVPVIPVLGFVVTLLLAGRLHRDALAVAAVIVAAGYAVGLVGARRR